MISSLIYFVGLIGWFFVWHYTNGYKLSKDNPLLLVSFWLCIVYLSLNMLFIYFCSEPSSIEFEQNRFTFIDSRIGNTIGAASSVLVIALVVYGLTIKKLPVEFVKFMVLSFIFQLAVSTPILWIPEKKILWFQYLKDFQTVGFTYAIFLCIAGIIMLFKSLTEIQEITIDSDAIK